MQLSLRIAAFLFAFFDLLGYDWWDRSHLSFLESIYWLSPALALLVLASVPYRLLYLYSALRWTITFLYAIGMIRLIQDMVGDWHSPLEPDTSAIALRFISLVIFGAGTYLAWRPVNKAG